MKVTIFGSGYVGLVTGACLAEAGNHVVCVDIDAGKVAMLNAGEVPIHEPGLDALIRRNRDGGRLEFTTDAARGVDHGLFQLIAVGTPPDEDGSADLRHVLSVAREIGARLQRYAVVVTKSTVPVGTADKVREQLTSALAARGASVEFDVVSNPEFLKEGVAIQDFLKPDRIVVGADSARSTELMHALYEPFTRNHDRLIVMDIRSAELTKYAANAMLAARISFMNEMTILCEAYGADVEDIRKGIGTDYRIGPAFLRAGCGYGGSCFPKDVAALEHISRAIGHENLFVNAIQTINKAQKKRFVEKVISKLGRPIDGATIAVWGLAFKADTDDIRESAALDVIRYLLEKGARVRATDPKAMENMKQVFKDEVEWMPDPVSAAVGADAVALLTDWPQYSTLPFRKIAATMNQPLIFDGRNCLHRDVMRENGFQYYPMGRPAVENKLRLKTKV